MSTITETAQTKQLILLTADGPKSRSVSSKASRDCTPDEIPIIDLTKLWGDLQARKKLAQEILWACENTGFFYVKNHGISKPLVDQVVEKSQK
jgi:hypothetical protein